MVRLLTTLNGIHHGGGDATGNFFQSVPLAIGLFVSITALVALCAKHAIRRRSNDTNNPDIGSRSTSMIVSPKNFLASIANKAIPFICRKNTGHKYINNYEIVEDDDRSFGDGGLWQRGILMGEKCQPPDFSGVIYYDMDGNKLSEIPPKSPRVSPLQASFTFPVARESSY